MHIDVDTSQVILGNFLSQTIRILNETIVNWTKVKNRYPCFIILFKLKFVMMSLQIVFNYFTHVFGLTWSRKTTHLLRKQQSG